MGLFARKNKNKTRVSFGADVGGDDSSHLHKTSTTEDDEKIEKPPTNTNSTASSSSSSRKPHIERGDEDEQEYEDEQHQESSFSGEIFLPFREGKALSFCSDIESKTHQSNGNVNVNGNRKFNRNGNRLNDEADCMNDSDGMVGMEEMTADPHEDHEEYFGLLAPEDTDLANEGEQSIKNSINHKATIGTTVMPMIDDVDEYEDEINKSAIINDRDATPDGTNMLALPIVSNYSNSTNTTTNNNNNNETPKAQGKTSYAAATPNKSLQVSATSTAPGSIATAREQQQVQQQQQQQQQQQNQHEYYPQQQQHQQLQHAEQSEQTRDLVKIFIGEIWNRGEIESIQKVCSPRLRFNGHTGLERVGHDGLSRMVTTVRSSLSGYHCEIHSMVVEGRKCFCRLKFTGKHVGELMGYPPTHKLVAWMGASEFTICPRRQQILKVWELGDIKTLEAQLMG